MTSKVLDGSDADRKRKLTSGLDIAAMRGLEIAPLSRVTVSKDEGEILYVDRSTTDELINRHKTDQTFDFRNIVPVDVALGDQSLPEALGEERFDYIIASHVIEHVPNLISWFEEFESILNERGTVRLAIPDKRFTFDYLRQPSVLEDVLAAHVCQAGVPPPRQVLDNCLNAVKLDLRAAWDGKIDEESLENFHTPEFAIHVAAQAFQGAYNEVHCWVFTPRSFGKLFSRLAEMDLVNFACADYFNTTRYTFEFFVVLERSDDREKINLSWEKMAQKAEG